MHTVSWPLRIYYDHSCPLCRQEMHGLVAGDRSGRIELADCSAPGLADAEAVRADFGVAEMQRIIHARDAAGVWYRGVEVFVIAYDAVGLTGMARMWSHPWLRPLWERLYPWFARNRMRLSRFGVAAAYGALVRRAAERAAQRSAGCRDGVCER